MNDKLIKDLKSYCAEMADRYFSNMDVIKEIKKRIKKLEQEAGDNEK